MKSTEFLQEFNILYNNINSDAAPGFEPFEISVLLTKAQDELLKNYFNPLGNKYKEGYDDSIKRQIDFSTLNSVVSLKEAVTATPKFDSRAIQYELPLDVLFMVNEELIFQGEGLSKTRQVIPLAHEDYIRLMSKPYGEPLKNQAWRLIGNPGTLFNIIEVIPNINDRLLIGYTKTYTIRYIRRPKPILLMDFSTTGQSIDGYMGTEADYNLENPCELNPEIHREIVQRAVELAKAGYLSEQVNVQTQMGSRSE